MRVCVSSPYLISFFDLIDVHAYGLFFVLGLLCFIGFFVRDARSRLRVSTEKLLDIIFCMLVFGLIGARLLYVFEFPELLDQGLLNVVNPRAGGLSILGSLVFAPIAGIVACIMSSIPVAAFFDTACTYIPIFDAFGRLGCFFGGCCYGIASSGFFSVMYSDLSAMAPVGEDLVPIQLIAATAFLGLFGLLRFFSNWLKQKSLEAPGALTFGYFAGACFIRFIIDFWRADRSASFLEFSLGGVAVSVTWYQSISLIMCAFSLLGVCMILRKAMSKSSELV